MAKKNKQVKKNNSKNLVWLTALSVLLIAAGVFYFAGRQSAGSDEVFRNVSVTDLKNANEADMVILDVRTQPEYDQAHIDGVRLIPVQELESRLDEIEDIKDRPVYVICNSGNRSMTASEILEKGGFKDIRNVQGGIQAWMRAGFPVVR